MTHSSLFLRVIILLLFFIISQPVYANAPHGIDILQPEINYTGCVIPPSGPWPACATGVTVPTTTDANCVIPPSGPWPPCATGKTVPSTTDANCVIPTSGPWPACATGKTATEQPDHSNHGNEAVALTNFTDGRLVVDKPMESFQNHIFFTTGVIYKNPHIVEYEWWMSDGTTVTQLPIPMSLNNTTSGECGQSLIITTDDAVYGVDSTGVKWDLPLRNALFWKESNGICYIESRTPDTSELWRSDGSAEGTVKIHTWNISNWNGIEKFITLDDGRYVLQIGKQIGKEIWIGDVNNTSRLHAVNGTLLAATTSGIHIGLLRIQDENIWRGYDLSGNLQWEKLLGTAGMPNLIGRVGNHTFFTLPESSPLQTALFISDGNEPVWVTEVGIGTPSGQAFNNKFYFELTSKEYEEQLWQSDTTVQGTFPFWTGRVSDLQQIGDRLLFKSAEVTSKKGNELWISDGTTAGTRQISNFASMGWDVKSHTSVVATDSHYYMTAQVKTGGKNQLIKIPIDSTIVQSTGSTIDCVIPSSGPWPPCAR